MARTKGLKSIGKAYISVNPELAEQVHKKKSKPWNKRVVEERGVFDNVSDSDLREGFHNKTNAKRFSNHTYRQRME